jgi:hypothetical protein
VKKLKRSVRDLIDIGKGSCKGNSNILDEEHWLEVKDSKHRYGSILKHY